MTSVHVTTEAVNDTGGTVRFTFLDVDTISGMSFPEFFQRFRSAVIEGAVEEGFDVWVNGNNAHGVDTHAAT